MSEKKKGFWSWLGFGKKEAPKQAAEITEEIAEEITEEIAEKAAEDVTEEIRTETVVAPSLSEEKAEKAEQTAQKEEAVEDNAESLVAMADNTIETEVIEEKDHFQQTQNHSLITPLTTENVAEHTIESVAEIEKETMEEATEESIVEESVAEESIAKESLTEENPSEESIEAQEENGGEAEDTVVEDIVAEDAIEEATEEATEETTEEAITEEVVNAEITAEMMVDEEQADDFSEQIANDNDLEPLEAIQEETVENAAFTDEYQEKPSQGGFFSRLIQGLIKTKQNIGSSFRHLFRGKKIDDDLFEELEEQLLIADLGMPTTTKIINNLSQHATRKQLNDAEALYQLLKEELTDVIKPVSQPLEIDRSKKPYVILMVGVNGVGKTTTIGKLARQFQQEGKSVMLAAGDTFRAAAVEQLQVWGERNGIPVVAQATGSDSASVIFDAMQSASAKEIDVLIADTAGRLQNKNNLMDELKKIVRVMKKYDETAPHEIMLTLDAGTGQNAISQAKLFNEAVGLTGITLTKLDGTAKGGVIFAIADQFKLPIRFIGVGEKIDDLRPFNAEEFIEALFTHEQA